MKLLQLVYFREVAESEHLTNAAKTLRISPPSLCHSIKSLEEELGVPLFDHIGREIRLNDYGHSFLQTVTKVLNELERGKQDLLAINTHKNSISILINNPTIWSTALSQYQSEHPAINLNIQLSSQNWQSQIPSSIDFYLCNLYDLEKDAIQYQPLLPDEQFMVAMNKGHRLAKATSLDLRDLGKERFFLPSFTGGAMIQEPLFKIAGIKAQNMLSGDRYDRLNALRMNRCIAITTTLGLKLAFDKDPNIIGIPLNYPVAVRRQVIAWKKEQVFSDIQQDFYDFITEYFKKNQDEYIMI